MISEMPPGGKRGSTGVVFVLVVFVPLEVPVCVELRVVEVTFAVPFEEDAEVVELF